MVEIVRYYNDDGEEVPPEQATRFEVTDDDGNVTIGDFVRSE